MVRAVERGLRERRLRSTYSIFRGGSGNGGGREACERRRGRAITFAKTRQIRGRQEGDGDRRRGPVNGLLVD